MKLRLYYSASLYDVFELQLACETVALAMERQRHTAASSDTEGTSTSLPATDSAVDAQQLSEAELAAETVIDQTLSQCAKAIAEVSPGSDLHAILAAR